MNDIQISILKLLYNVWWEQGQGGDIPLDEIASQLNLERRTVDSACVELKAEGLLDSVAAMTRQISPEGILTAESDKLVGQDKVKHNENVRNAILRVVSQMYEEHGVGGYASQDELIQIGSLELIDLRRNGYVLAMMGLTEHVGMGGYAITPQGHKFYKKRAKEASLADEFESLKTDTSIRPQRRGHELERLLSTVIESEGWSCKTNVRGPDEEHDLVINQGREYYLAECKWERNPVGAPTISRLRDKATARVGTNGLFFSMSGYARTALSNTQEGLQRRTILLFGPNDIENIIHRRTTFTDLLNSKFDLATSKRRIEYS